MTTSQREQHLKKIANASVTCSDSFSSETSVATSICISVDVTTLAGTVRTPLTCLEGIWKKAADLLKTKDAIVPAPGVSGNAKYVMSYTRQRPHLVVSKKDGSFACDENCLNCKNLCSCSGSC